MKTPRSLCPSTGLLQGAAFCPLQCLSLLTSRMWAPGLSQSRRWQGVPPTPSLGTASLSQALLLRYQVCWAESCTMAWLLRGEGLALAETAGS